MGLPLLLLLFSTAKPSPTFFARSLHNMAPRETTTDCTEALTSASTKDDPFGMLEPWQVFPAHQWKSLQEIHGPNVKLIHVVRHAEGAHNVNQEYKSPINIDARLTDNGFQQCRDLAERVRAELHEVLTPHNTCIVTSPLTRCVQTALHSFPHLISHVPVLAQEAWRETVNYNCDRRRTRQEIAQEFPLVQLGDCIDHDDVLWNTYRERLGDDWDTHMESAELYRVAQRGIEALRALQQRPESHLVVCTHSAFLRCILNWGQQGGVPKLMPQRLDDRQEKRDSKLFHYAEDVVLHSNDQIPFEEFMRRDFENCELRSFCMLVQESSSDDSIMNK